MLQWIWILLCVWVAVSQPTYIEQTPTQVYPPLCIFNASLSLPFAQLNQSYADQVCREEAPSCVWAVAYLSFPNNSIIQQYACSDVGLSVCSTFITIGTSTLLALVNPLFRPLEESGFPSDQTYWTNTNAEGDYLPCAVTDTSNEFLFSTETANCNTPHSFLCMCIQPSGIPSEFIILTWYPYYREGEISLVEEDVHILVPFWYVVSPNLLNNGGYYPLGIEDVIPTFGEQFYVEKVNTQPYPFRYFLQLRGYGNGTWIEEYRLGDVLWNIEDEERIVITPPVQGVIQWVVLLDHSVEEIIIDTCTPCLFDRYCVCMHPFQNETMTIQWGITHNQTSRVTMRYLLPE